MQERTSARTWGGRVDKDLVRQSGCPVMVGQRLWTLDSSSKAISMCEVVRTSAVLVCYTYSDPSHSASQRSRVPNVSQGGPKASKSASDCFETAPAWFGRWHQDTSARPMFATKANENFGKITR